MHRDMTDVQEQQRMLQLRSRVLNCMSDGIFIADCSGCLMHTNQGFAKLTGYCQSEAVGRAWTFLLVRDLIKHCYLCCAPLLSRLQISVVSGANSRTAGHYRVSFNVHLWSNGILFRQGTLGSSVWLSVRQVGLRACSFVRLCMPVLCACALEAGGLLHHCWLNIWQDLT